jgi:hypothetical protein
MAAEIDLGVILLCKNKEQWQKMWIYKTKHKEELERTRMQVSSNWRW